MIYIPGPAPYEPDPAVISKHLTLWGIDFQVGVRWLDTCLYGTLSTYAIEWGLSLPDRTYFISRYPTTSHDRLEGVLDKACIELEHRFRSRPVKYLGPIKQQLQKFYSEV